MMYLEDFRATCSARFDTQFSAAYPAVPIWWENKPFEQPDGLHYVSFRIVETMGNEAEIGTGTKTERYNGMLRIKVYEPKDQGTKVGNEIAQVAARIFYRQGLTGASWVARFTRGVRFNCVNSGEWKVYVIDINYERDERNSN